MLGCGLGLGLGLGLGFGLETTVSASGVASDMRSRATPLTCSPPRMATTGAPFSEAARLRSAWLGSGLGLVGVRARLGIRVRLGSRARVGIRARVG